MLKRFSVLTLVIVCLIAFATPASAATRYSAEGFNIYTQDAGNSAEIVGSKLQYSVDGATPISYQATFSIRLQCNGGSTLNVPAQTVAVPRDFDWLEVSDDLGWAGLNARVQVYDTVSASYVWVRVNLEQEASGAAYMAYGQSRRDGTKFRGRVVTPACTVLFNSPNTGGFNFFQSLS